MFRAQARYVRVTVTGLPAGVYASIRNLEVYDRPFTADLGTYKVINRNSGKALDVSNASTADGATLIQWPYGGGTNQQWSLLPNTDGSFRLANVKSGKLLQSPNSTQGATLTQESDNGGDNQWWKLVPSATSGYYRLVNVRTGRCADVANASTTDGTKVIQWPVTDGSNQDWQIVSL
ncbi:RICIN domain-containing protein [Streptomyces sp. NPDC020794]|uniref:RICIN domain-containing protein n=1 Tax=Streptomyces sp. NPDC020794 TaxID=3365090 RepID=UPI0037A560FF